MLLIIFSVIFLAIAAVLFAISQRLKYFSKQGIPGPKPKFLFGHTKESFMGKKNLIYEIDDVYRFSRGKYPFVGFFKGLNPKYLILNPDILKKISTTDSNVFRNNDFNKLVNKRKDPILAMNPFFAIDDQWKEKRAEVTSVMTINKLKSIYPIAIEVTKKLIAHVDEKLTRPYDIGDLCARYTCDLISNSLFDVDVHAFTADNPEIYEHSKKIMKGISSAFGTMCPKQMFPSDSAAFFRRLLVDSIRRRNEMTYKRDDFLTHLITLQQQKNFTEDVVLSQMWTLYMMSFETAGIALEFLFYELAKDQKVQDKLREEINANLDGADKLSFDTIMELEYLDQVFYEALRLHPPLIYTTKVCSEPYEIDGAKGHKYQMQKGDVAVISIYSIHRDPDHYPHPESFEPERFDAAHGGVQAFIDKCVLLPFGLGGRICPGEKLSNVIIKTAAVEILKNYRLTIDESVPENLEIGVNEFFNVINNNILVHFQKL